MDMPRTLHLPWTWQRDFWHYREDIELKLAGLASKNRLVIPLMGQPGARLTNSTLKQNLFNPALQVESISRLVDKFKPDAAFFIMDLSVEAGALGLQVLYPASAIPTVESHPVKTLADLDPFRVVDPLEDARVLSYIRTMELMAKRLPVLKGGYVIGPFTLAGLLMGVSDLAMATVTDPDLVYAVVQFSADISRRYANALCEAGADIIAVLEPTATLLSPQAFEMFCGPQVYKVIKDIPAMTVLHICGRTGHLVPNMCHTGFQGLSLDAPVDLVEAARIAGPDIVVMGNIEPAAVMAQGTPDDVRKRVRGIRAAMDSRPNFILSTGCDIPHDTPFENIEAFMEEGRK